LQNYSQYFLGRWI